MVYNNFILRLFFSLLFITFYIYISVLNFSLIFYIVTSLYILIFLEIYLNFQKYKFYPLVYIGVSFLFFLNINFNDDNFINFNIFVFTVVSFDISSYLVGKTIGKKKLINISPNKTIEGFLGGLIISLLLTLSIVYLLDNYINPWIILYILTIIITSFIGDILESFFKRKNYLKNSSEIIPGHGGLFDRFDSFIFSIIIYSITVNILQ